MKLTKEDIKKYGTTKEKKKLTESRMSRLVFKKELLEVLSKLHKLSQIANMGNFLEDEEYQVDLGNAIDRVVEDIDELIEYVDSH